ncbi:prephenate dehydrogenase/arogenate dehydrogenase family protein [Nocardioides sp. 1609]|uniref:prephenate dehydrogenase/arogenate dehydrogenase family protein n=1 Tax=Nocardioides sp. 1609 TaxID=2508327 RepID=UPI001430395E|nr:prephenate dehydrogenase/arogenate dehydrogenase family protein [Nocardioides sp. 1609]
MTGFERVAVVGAGLIGGSVARRLHARGVDVVVVDPDPGTRAAASAAGLAVADVLPADRDLVVLATPLDALAVVLADAAVAAPDAVVVDVGSVKVAAARAAAAAGLAGRYVGAHPMAGTEQSGFEHSYPDLLVGVRWAVARGDGPVADVVRFVVEVFGATAVVLDAAEHDRAVGLVSHAPHVLANALLELAERADEPTAAHLAAGSFRDGTRVAGRNAERTRNMLADNADALAGVLDDLVILLAHYRRELADPDALGARLQSVVDGSAPVRRPDADWRACPDLGVVLAAPGPVLVRAGAGGLEWAPAHP